MNGRELVMLADVVAKEKGLNQEVVLQALEEGIATSIRKNYPQGVEISVNIDPQLNSVLAWRVFKIKKDKKEIKDYETEILESSLDVEKGENDVVEDDLFFQKIDFNLTRSQFNITRQVAIQKLKTEIKEQMLDNVDYDNNKLLFGVVKLVKKDSLTVDLNSLDVIIYKNSLMSGDKFFANDKIAFVVDKVIRNVHSTTIVGTRRSEKFVEGVLMDQVPYIKNGSISVKKISRIPGHSVKVVVSSNSENVDAIRGCIGSKAQNVKNMNNFIPKEFIDFIEWNENKAEFLINCLQPIQPIKISIEEDLNKVDVVINELDLRWTEKDTFNQHLKNLVNWEVNFYTDKDWNKKEEVITQKATSIFVKALDVDTELALSLVEMGFASLDELAYTPKEEFDLEVLDEDTVMEIKNRAIDFIKSNSFEYMLYNVGFSVEQAELILTKNKEITKMSDLADLDAFELKEMVESLSIEEARSIILKSREYQEENFGMF